MAPPIVSILLLSLHHVHSSTVETPRLLRTDLSCIRMSVKKTGNYLYVGREDDALSTIAQDSDNFSQFLPELQSDNSYMLKVKATLRYLHEDGTQFLSGRNGAGNTKFLFEEQGVGSGIYDIKVKANSRSWHANDTRRGDKLVSTRYQSEDDYALFRFEACSTSPTDPPAPSPTAFPIASPTDPPAPSTTDSPITSPTDPPVSSPIDSPTRPPVIAQECIYIRVLKKGLYLRVSPDDEYLSVRDQIKDNYSKFMLETQSNNLYRMRVLATGRYLKEHPSDLILSTRTEGDEDHTRFYLKVQGDGTRKIQSKATNDYWHSDTNGDGFTSTRYQSDDAYAQFIFEECFTDAPTGTPTGTPTISTVPTRTPIISPSTNPSGRPSTSAPTTPLPTRTPSDSPSMNPTKSAVPTEEVRSLHPTPISLSLFHPNPNLNWSRILPACASMAKMTTDTESIFHVSRCGLPPQCPLWDTG